MKTDEEIIAEVREKLIGLGWGTDMLKKAIRLGIKKAREGYIEKQKLREIDLDTLEKWLMEHCKATNQKSSVEFALWVIQKILKESE